MKEQMLTRVPKWINDRLKQIALQKGISKNALITIFLCDSIKEESR